MAKVEPWTIYVVSGKRIISQFVVPAHKLQKKSMLAFLKALVARYSSETPEEMLLHYVTRTPGAPLRTTISDAEWKHDPEAKRGGCFCGDIECFAAAWQRIDEQTATTLIRLRDQNRSK